MSHQPYLRHRITGLSDFDLDYLYSTLVELINVLAHKHDGDPDACWNILRTPVYDQGHRGAFWRLQSAFEPVWDINVMPLGQDKPTPWMTGAVYNGLQLRTALDSQTTLHLTRHFETCVSAFEEIYSQLDKHLRLRRA